MSHDALVTVILAACAAVLLGFWACSLDAAADRCKARGGELIIDRFNQPRCLAAPPEKR